MRTIEIPEWLVQLAGHMNDQDNRSTQLPLFVVQEKVLVSNGEDDDDEQWQFNLQAGVFLTAAACDNHINAKRHRYSTLGTRSYGISAYHSQEMANVLEWLSKLGTGTDEPASQYRA